MEQTNKNQTFQEIPVEKAALIGEIHAKDQVIIYTADRINNSVTVTTWGKTVHDADQAAEAGNNLKSAIGWPDKHCHAVSAKVEFLLNALSLARFELILSNKQNSKACKLIEEALHLDLGEEKP